MLQQFNVRLWEYLILLCVRLLTQAIVLIIVVLRFKSKRVCNCKCRIVEVVSNKSEPLRHRKILPSFLVSVYEGDNTKKRHQSD